MIRRHQLPPIVITKEDDRFYARIAYRKVITAKKQKRERIRKEQFDAEMAAYEARPKFKLIKAADVVSRFKNLSQK
jgi:hypothetical protein